MSNTVYLPTMVPTSWDGNFGNGQWLFWFTNTLSSMLSMDYFYTKEKQAAVLDMDKAKNYFYRPPLLFCSTNRDWEDERECWEHYISAASTTGDLTPALEEFHQYVANGRQSVMTFEEVVQCLNSDKSKLYLLNHALTEEEIAAKIKFLTEGYLTRLRDLRCAVDKVIGYLKINKPRLVKDYETGEAYQFDLRPLYWEFQDHYAYETALYLIMYKDESLFKFLRDDLFDC